ncbi:hypothetical protein RDWZM_004779 [Blomia tropicalis]|uniref:Uncharacterized protein n=1 Tax=Blomia tropicalis TaxID=40697 RepID=A0A9Q0M6R5_BLOTA|nr:hypothetical protein RDWZM_004779 [Blomia tropicalis]
MFKFVVVVSALVCMVSAYGGSGGYGRSSGSSSGGGYGNGGSIGRLMSGGRSRGMGSTGGQVVQAAIQTKHQIEFRDVPSSGFVEPTTIEVGASSIPLNILFRSASSNLNIQQQHDGAGGSTQESESEDEPHVLKHSVTKPIIQEVRELITPSRKIVQEIQPVQEEILTIVAKSDDNQRNVANGMGNFGMVIGGGSAAAAGSSSC